METGVGRRASMDEVPHGYRKKMFTSGLTLGGDAVRETTPGIDFPPFDVDTTPKRPGGSETDTTRSV